MVIEKLRLEDVEDLIDLYKELVPFENKFEKTISLYKEMEKDDNYFLVVAKENDKIVGSMLAVCCNSLASLGNPFLVIEDVVVKAEYRKLGIGKKLMNEVDKYASLKNCTYAIVVSSNYRKNAHKFYENIGFRDEVVGFRKLYK